MATIRLPHDRVPQTRHDSSSDSDSDAAELDLQSEGSDTEDDNLEEESDYSDDEPGGRDRIMPDGFERAPYPEDDTLVLSGRDAGPNGEPPTQWRNIPPPSARRRVWNNWTMRDGGLGARVGIDHVKEACESQAAALLVLNLTDGLIQETVKWTNDKAEEHCDAWNALNAADPESLRIWKTVDDIEMKAFIGLLLLAGVMKGKREPIKELWASDEKYKKHAFSATMSRDRFINILRYLRFDDRRTRQERKEQDKLAAIRTCVDMFQSNLRDIYEPSEYLCVDEQLIRFRGRCGFRVFIKSKPGRYGLKVWACVDAKTGFVINMQIYIGKEGLRPEIQQGKRVLMDMIRPFFNTGRSVTADNFFGTVAAAKELLEKHITLVATIRKDRREIPTELRKSVGRDVLSSQFWYTEEVTLVSYVPKRNKNVLLVSTQHSDPLVSTDHHKKPEIILHYNITKGGVDNVDQMIETYSCQRGTRRWPCKIFMYLVDTAALNAYVMWTQMNPNWLPGYKNRRRIFLRDVAEGLILPHIHRRSWDHLQLGIIKSMQLFGAKRPASAPAAGQANPRVGGAEQPSRGKCVGCKNRVRKTCSHCSRFLCDNCADTIRVCNFCRGDDEVIIEQEQQIPATIPPEVLIEQEVVEEGVVDADFGPEHEFEQPVIVELIGFDHDVEVIYQHEDAEDV